MLLCAGVAQAAREPVLQQVDLPHSYYWRELYLPQLTTGPSSVSFLPDSNTLVYSMEGSLWRQRIGEDTATELTHAARAYDYQPDVSHDGRYVVFSRYDGNGIELWRQDLGSGQTQALTSGGAVNVEPRLSPDGRQIAWVSTRSTGHFNLFIADIDAAGLHHAHLLLGERKSTLDRYYYSAFDHAINPSWSPDGKTLYYVSNPETELGTGDLWSVPVNDPAHRQRILREETSWSARPELAPDDKRLLYSSYHGRQWQQLWLTTPDGAAPLPLTFGDFDRLNARWSPDGQRIATIDNRDGNTALRVIEVLGGASRDVVAKRRVTRLPQARLVLDITDEPVCARRPGLPCWPATAVPMRRITRGCTPTTASTARCRPARRIISCALRRARWRCLPAEITRAARLRLCTVAQEPRAGRRQRGAAQGAVAARAPARQVRQVHQRRPAHAHELRRSLSQHAGAPGIPGARRGPRSRLGTWS